MQIIWANICMYLSFISVFRSEIAQLKSFLWEPPSLHRVSSKGAGDLKTKGAGISVDNLLIRSPGISRPYERYN